MIRVDRQAETAKLITESRTLTGELLSIGARLDELVSRLQSIIIEKEDESN